MSRDLRTYQRELHRNEKVISAMQKENQKSDIKIGELEATCHSLSERCDSLARRCAYLQGELAISESNVAKLDAMIISCLGQNTRECRGSVVKGLAIQGPFVQGTAIQGQAMQGPVMYEDILHLTGGC
jgi:hypothetical protein